MFVHRTSGIVAATVSLAFAVGCSDPELNTGLRPDGPPEVLAVLVMTDPVEMLGEKATFCKIGDKYRPKQVGLPDFTTSQVCPDDLAQGVDPVDTAYPDGWYVRVMFDELLNPDIEQLTEIVDEDTGEPTGAYEGSIKDGNPVTLECQSVTNGEFMPVDYDGYYSPSGDRVSWPVGPSLVIKPDDPTIVATGQECRITLNDTIKDKDGKPVPPEQRGPFTFSIAKPIVIATDPSDADPDDLDPDATPTEVDALYLYTSNFYYQFNTDITIDSICKDTDFAGTFANVFSDADFGSGLCDEGTESFQLDPPVLTTDAGGGWGVCNITGDPCNTGADCIAIDPANTHCDSSYAYTYNGSSLDDEVGIGYNTPLKTDTLYTFSLKSGTKVKDRCGVETTLDAPTTSNLQAIRFKTNPFGLVEDSETNIVTGDVAPMARKPTLQFTNVVDPASLEPNEYTIDPVPAGFTISQFTGGDIIFAGNYAPDTAYTLKILKGATFSDFYGAMTTTEDDIVVSWKTQPRVALTAYSPHDADAVDKSTVQERLSVTLTFNANMDPTTLEPDTDFTFINTKTNQKVSTMSGFSVSAGSGGSGNYCDVDSLGCDLRVRADLPPGPYRFTLEAGAQMSDLLGNVYTQESDLVINFTVNKAPDPIKCL